MGHGGVSIRKACRARRAISLYHRGKWVIFQGTTGRHAYVARPESSKGVLGASARPSKTQGGPHRPPNQRWDALALAEESPPIDVQNSPRDKTCRLARQKEDGPGDLDGAAVAAQGRLFPVLLH